MAEYAGKTRVSEVEPPEERAAGGEGQCREVEHDEHEHAAALANRRTTWALHTAKKFHHMAPLHSTRVMQTGPRGGEDSTRDARVLKNVS